jgi:endonuclease YncB( thermonuclease family)
MRKRITIMQAAMLALFIGLFSAYAFANPYDWKVTRAVDGDTVEIQVTWLPTELGDKLKIRIFGVDTPEKGFRAKCESEAKRGEAATLFTKKMLADSKKIQVEIKEWDKFGGRVLGDVLVDGKSLRAELIKNGFAREYYGDAKQSWCN